MKRSERHHLKENEVALYVAQLRERYAEHRATLTAGVAAVVVVAVALGGYIYWRARADARASAMLAEGMRIEQSQVAPPAAPPQPGTPAPQAPAGTFPTEKAKLEAALPKFMAAADGYPSSRAGIEARYHAATTLALLGRTADAEQRYREVIDRDATGLYGTMARLGLADVQARTGKYDPAIAAYKELTANQNGTLPIDGVLMQLGRTYVLAGRTDEARSAFNRIVSEFPDSPYLQAARQELAALGANTRS
jgi:TolA-binding protein